MALNEEAATALRQILSEILTDSRFTNQTAVSAIEIAESLWREASSEERNFDNMKRSALIKLERKLNTNLANSSSSSTGNAPNPASQTKSAFDNRPTPAPET